LAGHSASKTEGVRREAPPARASDEALLAAHRVDPGGARGREAVSLLFGRYYGRVYAWCRRMVNDPERALDLAQEVMISAYRHLAHFEGRSRFGSWLFAIARNRCLGELRRPELLRDEEVDPDDLVVPRPDPERELIDRLDEEQLLTLIRERLEPREQEALWLRCFERMPVDAITEVLGVDGASGARGLLQQARRKLRAALSATVPAEPLGHREDGREASGVTEVDG
jgi:RNA polymerase sigma-70 factor (ECF subfamily)